MSSLPPRLATLYLTALANERLGRAFAPEPLAPDEVPAAARALEDLRDVHLLAEGDSGGLLADLARARAQELGPIRNGTVPDPAHVAALWVKG